MQSSTAWWLSHEVFHEGLAHGRRHPEPWWNQSEVPDVAHRAEAETHTEIEAICEDLVRNFGGVCPHIQGTQMP
jgi:hypothetical protein